MENAWVECLVPFIKENIALISLVELVSHPCFFQCWKEGVCYWFIGTTDRWALNCDPDKEKLMHARKCFYFSNITEAI